MLKLQNIGSSSVVVLVIFTAISAAQAASTAPGESFASKCPDIASCAKTVSELTGQKYIYDLDMKTTVRATANVEITADNAELLFTTMLNAEGLTRVPLAQSGVYQIMRQRDARDSIIPQVTADANSAPRLPDTWDVYTMTYKASHPDALEAIARNARSFMPANSRIIPMDLSGTLAVTDSAMNIKKLYAFITAGDVQPSAVQLKRWHEEWEMRKKNPPQPPAPPSAATPTPAAK